jgi:hypothetical protein
MLLKLELMRFGVGAGKLGCGVVALWKLLDARRNPEENVVIVSDRMVSSCGQRGNQGTQGGLERQNPEWVLQQKPCMIGRHSRG